VAGHWVRSVGGPGCARGHSMLYSAQLQKYEDSPSLSFSLPLSLSIPSRDTCTRLPTHKLTFSCSIQQLAAQLFLNRCIEDGRWYESSRKSECSSLKKLKRGTHKCRFRVMDVQNGATMLLQVNKQTAPNWFKALLFTGPSFVL